MSDPTVSADSALTIINMARLNFGANNNNNIIIIQMDSHKTIIELFKPFNLLTGVVIY